MITQHLGFTTGPLAMVASVIAAMLMGQPAYGGHVVQPTTPDGGVHLVTPTIGGERGKEVFVSKGCIACHANGVGGHDAPKLDARTMQGLMNSFDFAARMWNHAPTMILAKEDEPGEQTTLTGQDPAGLVAFVHNEEVPDTLTEATSRLKRALMMDHEQGGA